MRELLGKTFPRRIAPGVPTFLAVLLYLGPAAQAAPAGGVVDLTDPRQLQSLRDHRPEHYAKARVILAIATTRPTYEAGRWMETRVGASQVELLQWRVSDPPKLQVSFTLDDTRYTAQVVPTLEPARPVPAR
jgi:hypothetical protein